MKNRRTKEFRKQFARLLCEESMAGPLITLVFSSAKLDAALEKWLTAIKAGSEGSAS